MSFLDNVIVEKPAIVIDIGHAYTKCGFAGETGPHTIIPSIIAQETRGNKSINIHNYKNLFQNLSSNNISLNRHEIEEETLKEILIEFLYRIFFKILNSNARERKVVIVESILTNSFFRKVLAEVLFKNFQTISVLFLPTHLAALYTLGLNTGLVIDCCYSGCEIMPISESVPMAGLCNFVNLGAQKLHQELERLIKEHAFITTNNQKMKLTDLNASFVLTEEILEDIKLRCCFVTSFTRSRQLKQEISSIDALNPQLLTGLKFQFAPDCDYNLSDNKILHIPGYLREMAFEVLFVDNLDSNQTIQHSILDTIIRSPIDLKKKFSENLILIGGTCMLTGFKHRLVSELNHLINDTNEIYAEKLPFKILKFHVPPSQENYTAWLGGAIFGSLDILDAYSIQNSKYKDLDKIPDWFNITQPANNMVSI